MPWPGDSFAEEELEHRTSGFKLIWNLSQALHATVIVKSTNVRIFTYIPRSYIKMFQAYDLLLHRGRENDAYLKSTPFSIIGAECCQAFRCSDCPAHIHNITSKPVEI